MTEPTKGERTKKKLVDATAVLLRKQGYHATGLSAIIDESGAPRGSVYFYFPGGKDELAVAAIEQAGAEWRARLETAIAGAKDLGSAIDTIMKTVADDLAASNWENGCPVAGVALESPSEVVREAVRAHFVQWQEDIAAHVVAFGIPKAAAKQLATVALAATEGALLLARVQRSKQPLLAVGAALRAMVSSIA